MTKYPAHGYSARKERCGTCHFLVVGQREFYECHRKGPQISIKKECDDEGINPISIWPNVMISNWCGEYAPKKRGA